MKLKEIGVSVAKVRRRLLCEGGEAHLAQKYRSFNSVNDHSSVTPPLFTQEINWLLIRHKHKLIS